MEVYGLVEEAAGRIRARIAREAASGDGWWCGGAREFPRMGSFVLGENPKACPVVLVRPRGVVVSRTEFRSCTAEELIGKTGE